MGTIYSKQNAERLDVEETTKETYKEIKEDIKNSGITLAPCDGHCCYCKYADECDESYIKNGYSKLRGARRNGKTLEQMYQLVQYSKAPMKPSLWIARIDGKLEQRVVMEKEDYDKLQIKAQEQEKVLKLIKEKNVHLDYLNKCSDAKQYNKAALLDEELSDEEFNLLKEYAKQ